MPKYNYYNLFLFFWLSAFLLYYRAHGAQFVYDQNMWAVQFDKQGWRGLITQFGDKSVHYIFQCIYFIFYKIFKWHGWYWTGLQTAWHALNATLFFAVIYKWSAWYRREQSIRIAFWAALFFLMSPYHTEVVIWGAGLEYMVVTTFILSGLLSFSFYLENTRTMFAILSYSFYFLSLLTWELGLIFSFMILLLCIVSPYDRISFRHVITVFFLPMAILIPLYFAFSKWVNGAALAHYGAAVHLNMSSHLIIPNMTRFIIKLFDISLIFHRVHSTQFIGWISTPHAVAVQALVYIVLFIACAYAVIVRRYLFLVLVTGMTVISLIPLLNLYFAYYTYIESDRYVYLCSGFFYGGLVWFIFLLSRWLAFLILLIFLFVQVFFLHGFVNDWRTSGKVVHGLVEGFKWQSAHHIYILATPDAVNGAWCLRSVPAYGISIALQAQRHIDIKDKMTEIVQYEITGMTDSTYAEKVGEGTYRYKMTQYGDWFINSGQGSDHHQENDYYTLDIDESGKSYILKIKRYQPGDAVIYQVKDRWLEVK